MRGRLRCVLWGTWNRPATRARKLRALGLSAERARLSGGNGHGPWWNAGASHMNLMLPAKYFTTKGLGSPMGTHQRLQSLSSTAGGGPARAVVWEGGERKLNPTRFV